MTNFDAMMTIIDKRMIIIESKARAIDKKMCALIKKMRRMNAMMRNYFVDFSVISIRLSFYDDGNGFSACFRPCIFLKIIM